MRIHGELTLNRSDKVEQENDYKKYMLKLSEDFSHICGYCGKSEKIATKGFEIDHFVPETIDSSRKLDYTNLVYSCFTCNRKKSGKWPTKDKDKPNDEINGFVDPASQEYDKHLGRDNDGNIEYYTDVGKYMCEVAFKFDKRPMKEMWKIMQLIDSKEKLYKIREKLTQNEYEKYIKIDHKISELKEILFNKE